MHRVFCATPGDSQADLETERQAFHEVIGQLNEAEAMPREILFAPVSVLPNLTNMAVFQQSLDDNVRACTFFVQVLHRSWGPPARNFERLYDLATQCCAGSDVPMKGVSVFFKAPGGEPVEPQVARLRDSLSQADFETLDEFRAMLRRQLSDWLRGLS